MREREREKAVDFQIGKGHGEVDLFDPLTTFCFALILSDTFCWAVKPSIDFWLIWEPDRGKKVNIRDIMSLIMLKQLSHFFIMHKENDSWLCFFYKQFKLNQ